MDLKKHDLAGRTQINRSRTELKIRVMATNDIVRGEARVLKEAGQSRNSLAEFMHSRRKDLRGR